jgi:hypothetical protein
MSYIHIGIGKPFINIREKNIVGLIKRVKGTGVGLSDLREAGSGSGVRVLVTRTS